MYTISSFFSAIVKFQRTLPTDYWKLTITCRIAAIAANLPPLPQQQQAV
jgi:hypothetical protein